MRQSLKEKEIRLTRFQQARGFTLIELIVVIVILGLLAGLVVPRLFKHVGQARTATARAQISAFQTALGGAD